MCSESSGGRSQGCSPTPSVGRGAGVTAGPAVQQRLQGCPHPTRPSRSLVSGGLGFLTDIPFAEPRGATFLDVWERSGSFHLPFASFSPNLFLLIATKGTEEHTWVPGEADVKSA